MPADQGSWGHNFCSVRRLGVSPLDVPLFSATPIYPLAGWADVKKVTFKAGIDKFPAGFEFETVPMPCFGGLTAVGSIMGLDAGLDYFPSLPVAAHNGMPLLHRLFPHPRPFHLPNLLYPAKSRPSL